MPKTAREMSDQEVNTIFISRHILWSCLLADQVLKLPHIEQPLMDKIIFKISLKALNPSMHVVSYL